MKTYAYLVTGLASLFIAVLIAAPATQTFAADDANAQIRALLVQMEVLQQRLTAAMQKQQDTLVAVQDAASSSCYQPTRTLQQGARGDDVSALQQALRDKGFFDREPTGYFGSITRAAVERFQAAQGIVSAGEPAMTGYGLVGPATRRALWHCGAIGAGTERFVASPLRGAAPLEVSFKTWVGGMRPAGYSYTIEYGDGTTEPAAECFAPADACLDAGTNTHTYMADGTYTAVLVRIIDLCAGNLACKAAVQRAILATTTVTVGDVPAVACTMQYAPVCGAKQVQCFAAPCNPVPTTYGNACMMTADGATHLYDGECKTAVVDPQKDPQCKVWSDGCNTCSRSAPGASGMCTLMACMTTAGSMPQPYCKEYFSSGLVQ